MSARLSLWQRVEFFRRCSPNLVRLRLIEENADNPQEADRHDRDFHLLLLQASGNRVLQVFSMSSLLILRKQGSRYLRTIVGIFLIRRQKQREILLHIKKGDAQDGIGVDESTFAGKTAVSLLLTWSEHVYYWVPAMPGTFFT